MASKLELDSTQVYGDLKRIVGRAQALQTPVAFLRTAGYSIMGFAGPELVISWTPRAEDYSATVRTACFLPEALAFALGEIDRKAWTIRRVGLRRRGLQLYCRGEKDPVVHIDVAALAYIEHNVGPGFDSDGVLPAALLDVAATKP